MTWMLSMQGVHARAAIQEANTLAATLSVLGSSVHKRGLSMVPSKALCILRTACTIILWSLMHLQPCCWGRRACRVFRKPLVLRDSDSQAGCGSKPAQSPLVCCALTKILIGLGRGFKVSLCNAGNTRMPD